MRRGKLILAGVLLTVLISAICWLRLASSRADLAPPSSRLPDPWGALTPALRSARPLARVPSLPLALATLTTHARTSLLAVHAGGIESLVGPEVMDGGSSMLRGSALASLLLTGPDPFQNSIDVQNLEGGPSWEIHPDEGGVIFGFMLEPGGSQLVYLEVDGRSSGTQPPWRVVKVDLGNGARRAILNGAQDGNIALLPVDWESGTILLRGLSPFSPRFHGLWSVRADGTSLRKLLDESEYVGTPRLSPQADRLAVLGAQPGVRPPQPGPGEPTATAIEIHELTTDRRQPILLTDSQHEFIQLQWGAEGLLAAEGEWDDAQQEFVHRQVLQLIPDVRSAPEVHRFAIEGEIVRLASCPNEGWLVGVQMDDSLRIIRGNPTESVASFHVGTLDNLACLIDEP